MTPEARDAGRGIRDQIERYRTAFVSVVAMIVIAALVGGYILAHERLTLPGWVPIFGREYFTLKGEFQTAQAVAPGQGQSVTIAGAKIGEIASVDLENGEAVVTMHLVPKYAHVYHNATMLLRPKTQLKDMTVEINPGTPSTGRVPDGGMIPVAQTAPDVNFDEFLSSLDADTRAYLQELLAGAGQGLKGNAGNLSATFKRFPPLLRDVQEISDQVAQRQANVSRAIHNFKELLVALGGKDKQLSGLVDSSNAVFATFSKEDHQVQETLHELPGALKQTNQGLGKLTAAAKVVGPTLKRLDPFAKALGPAQQQTRPFLKTTTPIIEKEIRPFAREVLPVINRIEPSTGNLSESLPRLKTTFAVLNEFFNELAYNPGPSKGGFLFFLDWANHNLNSVLSSSDANGSMGHALVYFNCNILKILAGAEQVNPTAELILGLLNTPSEAGCVAATSGKAASVKDSAQMARLADHVFGQGPDTLAQPSSSIGSGN
jgi:phospholipid/cholesterol/gamma-HCH transport system substrate-binding protein